MFVVFVLLLLIPVLVAGVAFVKAAFTDGVSGSDGYHAVKSLFFFAPFVWLILKPAGRIVLDSGAQVLRYEPGWPKAVVQFPLEGLVAVDVRQDSVSSLQRLVLRYRDHSEHPVTEAFSYGRPHHEQVARELNTAISNLHAPRR